MKELKTIKDVASEYTNNAFSTIEPEANGLGEDLLNVVKGAVQEAFETGAQTVINELEFILKDYDRYDRMSCCLIRELIKKLKGEAE